MNSFRTLWQRIFPPVTPLPAGMVSYQAPDGTHRLHLRLEPDGQGVLIVNASTVIRLNRTAAEIAYHIVQHTPEEEAVAEISRRYDVRKEIIRRDYSQLQGQIDTLVGTIDLDPVTILNFERNEPYSGATLAPYRLDCALTYRLPDLDSGHFAPQERVSRELTGEEWQQILDKAWDAGVPHVIFTGGEPTLHPDLRDLIAYAESLGMVTGLITNGLKLAEAEVLQDILLAGLDHVMVVLDPTEEPAWAALRAILAQDIATTVHITLTSRTISGFETTLERLVSMGVQAISLSGDAGHLQDVQPQRNAIAERHMRLVWDLPAPYTRFNPVTLELLRSKEQPEGAGRAWLYVEPDGDVLPGQGQYETVLGNLLRDDWTEIWNRAGG